MNGVSLDTAVAVLGLVSGLGAIAGVLVSVGREKQSRVDLEARHKELAKEARESLASLKQQAEKLQERLTDAERDNATLTARLEDQRARLEDVKREKASVESVEALRESMGRVEGILGGMSARFDSFMNQMVVSKNQ